MLSIVVASALALGQLASAAIPANTPTALRIQTVFDNTTNCLAAAGNTDGSAVSVQPCSSAAEQNTWIFPSGIPDSGSSAAQNIKYGSLCLDVTGGVDASGTKVQLWTCASGNKNQQWVVNVDSTGHAVLQWAGHSRCLDNTSGYHNGTQAQVWSCTTGNTNQKFTPINASRTPPTGTPVQFGHGKDRKLCLGVPALYNSAPVTIGACEPEDPEKNSWIQSSAGGPVGFEDFCLDLTDGKNTNGNKLQIWTCEKNSKNQMWNLNQDSTISWNGGSGGKCVDLTNGNTTVGNQVQVWTCDPKNTNQQWVNLPPL